MKENILSKNLWYEIVLNTKFNNSDEMLEKVFNIMKQDEATRILSKLEELPEELPDIE